MSQKTESSQRPKSVNYYIELYCKQNNEEKLPRSLLKNLIKRWIERSKGMDSFSDQDLLKYISEQRSRLTDSALIKTINATGIILHTNLGRAPLTSSQMRTDEDLYKSYMTVEFDIERGSRGERNSLIAAPFLRLFRKMSNSENPDDLDVLIVNNNASALFLILNSLADRVIVSASELIEIGGSFRLPEVIANSGAEVVIVGCTNSVRPDDYLRSLKPNMRNILLKSSTSNYTINGFTKLMSVSDFASTVRTTPKTTSSFIKYYDAGTVLIEREDVVAGEWVRAEEFRGIDIISFSGDKTFGGPQAGIIIGRSGLIRKLKKNPIMRMLRTDKITLAVLEKTAQLYTTGRFDEIGFHRFYGRSLERLREMATGFEPGEVITRDVYLGAGSKPGMTVKSVAVRYKFNSHREAVSFKDYLLKSKIIATMEQNSSKSVLIDFKALYEDQVSYVRETTKDYFNKENR